jgi:tetratricopeptide (TPR) repeat protein
VRKLFDRLADRLRSFLEQRDDLVLVVRCPGLESAYILKILQSIDDGSASDVFWVFAENFSEPGEYTDRVVKAFQQKHDAVCELMRKEGRAPWPGVPASVLDARQPPVQRLRELMIYARSLLPAPDGHLLVWVLFPLEIAPGPAYARLIGELLRHDYPFPWCHHMRIILRDDAADPALTRGLDQTPHLSWCAPDLSQQAMEKSLEEEAADEDLPLPQRLQSLLVLAGLDYAHRRYAAALDKYQLLLRFHTATENHVLSGLVLNGIGEVYERQGDQLKAQSYYESALTPADKAKAYPLLLNITLNLANLKLAQKKWKEAETYYDAAEKFAAAQLIPQVKIQSLENRGFCQYQQGNIKGALECWTAGATLARSVDEKALLTSILQRLRDHYDKVGDRRQRKEIESELANGLKEAS